VTAPGSGANGTRGAGRCWLWKDSLRPARAAFAALETFDFRNKPSAKHADGAMPCCNSRLRGHAGVPKRPPGKHAGEDYCGAEAGAGTGRQGEGRCYRHGGATRGAGAPAGNSNAVTTGEHETIRPQDLTDEERAQLDAMPTDAATQTDLLIRLTVLRLRRMQGRIEELREEAGELVATEGNTERGTRAGGHVEVSVARRRAALDCIMEIEESITHLQGELILTLRLRREVTGAASGTAESENLLTDAVERATAQLEEIQSNSRAEDE
jgi:hypothetical protein